MPDRYAGTAAGLESPAFHGFAVTPNDSAELSEVTRAIYVGSAGDVAITMSSNATIIMENIPAGTLLPVRVRKVSATGTTASALIGLV